ncbi:hypothetical protein QQF64_020069 [Cirrhinus molitorella]|uniref:Uncharacterized protein n=1 Tax=Cirrhinus molitorella TaxID=172907 RepID=A0ABR3LLC4_9TELE
MFLGLGSFVDRFSLFQLHSTGNPGIPEKQTREKAHVELVSGLLQRETARRASKLDKEGLEVAVCRHGVILKGLNMYSGEIFTYPLFLQKDLQAATNIYCTSHASTGPIFRRLLFLHLH